MPAGEARSFFDTNVLVYAYDQSEPKRRIVASDLFRRAWEGDCAVISFQVLQEFFVTVTRKIEKPLGIGEAARICENLLVLDPVATDRQVFARALGLCSERSLSYWDAAIVAQALQAGCKILYSEDLQDGMHVEGLRVRNPFR